MALQPQRLTIRPATLDDKRNVYNWLANSNITGEMLGPPRFPDAPIPTWADFDRDYLDHYFDESAPLKGRCFILSQQGQDIGQINYNEIDTVSSSTEIDIWLADSAFTGIGLGTEAIKWLCNYLTHELSCKTVYIAPSKRNTRAIRAYQKAGFIETNQAPNNFTPDYYDSIVLKRDL